MIDKSHVFQTEELTIRDQFAMRALVVLDPPNDCVGGASDS